MWFYWIIEIRIPIKLTMLNLAAFQIQLEPSISKLQSLKRFDLILSLFI